MYRVDAQTAEMIMCLQNSVPNLHAPEVCQYLLSVLEYNSFAFGIDLSESSSDSNDSGSAFQHRMMNNHKRRLKGPVGREKEKKKLWNNKAEKPRKKIHKTEYKSEEDRHSKKEEEI